MLIWPDISFPPINLWSAPKMTINFDECRIGSKVRTKQGDVYVNTTRGWQNDKKGRIYETPIGVVVVIETPLCSYPNCNCPLDMPTQIQCARGYPIRKAGKS